MDAAERVNTEKMVLHEQIAACRPQIVRKCRFFFRHSPNRDDLAEDLAQDILIRAMKYSDGFRNECKLESWVYAVTNSTLIDYYRKSRRKSSGTKDVSLEDVVERHLSYTQRFPDHQEIQRRLDLLEQLPQDGKQLMLLVGNGYEYAEICMLMDIPEGTCKSRINRYRTYLKSVQ
jgi:RNA polymerase sigma-70 factor (ECF subfamily)